MQTTKLTWAERVRGSLVGGAVGGSLGASVAPAEPAGGRLGALTTDTVLSLFTAEGLLRGQRGDVTVELWRAYSRWLSTQGFDPGREVGERTGLVRELAQPRPPTPEDGCVAGLRQPTMGTRSQPTNPEAKGSGTVARSAPFGWLGGPADQAWALAIDGAVLTHGHPTARFSAAAMAVLVHALVGGEPLLPAVDRVCDRLDAAGPGAAETLRALRGVDAARTPELLGAGRGDAHEVLALAVRCALHATDGAAALLAAVNHAGSSHSVGAVCGNLVGAVHGVDALPTEWLTALEDRPLLERIADELVEAFWA